MRTIILLLGCLTAPATAPAQTAEVLGVIQNLTRAGANCGVWSAGLGYRCQLKLSSYQRPVDIFLPFAFRTTQPVTEAYHFHGFWTDPKQGPFDGAPGDYAKFVSESGKNVILVIPESRGKDVDYATGLGTAAQLNAFFSQTQALLIGVGIPLNLKSPLLLSSHSGAYVEMAKIGAMAKAGTVARLKALRGVALLDSPYSYSEGYLFLADQMCRNGPNVYYLAYNPNDGSASKKAAYLEINQGLTTSHPCAARKSVYLPDPHTVHVKFPEVHYSDFLSQAAD